MLRERGFALPAAAVRQRFVRLLDEAKRNELLIIYGEDAGEAGRSADSHAADQWSNLVPAVRERALRSFSIVDPAADASMTAFPRHPPGS